MVTQEQAIKEVKELIASAGFIASIFESDMQIHGGLWYRVNYSKKY